MRALAAIVILTCAIACSSDKKSKPAPRPRPAPDAAPKPPAIDAAPAATDPEYPNDSAGLQKLIKDLLAARQAGNADKTYTLTASLRFPEYETWFKETFGDKLGARLAADYKVQFDDIQLLADTLAELNEQGLEEIGIERFESGDDLKAVGYQVAALEAMKKPVALFSVRMQTKDGKRPFHIWSFVHDGKSFRYVGKMKPVAKPETSSVGDLGEFRVADARRLREPDKKDKKAEK